MWDGFFRSYSKKYVICMTYFKSSLCYLTFESLVRNILLIFLFGLCLKKTTIAWISRQAQTLFKVRCVLLTNSSIKVEDFVDAWHPRQISVLSVLIFMLNYNFGSLFLLIHEINYPFKIKFFSYFCINKITMWCILNDLKYSIGKLFVTLCRKWLRYVSSILYDVMI